MISEGGWPPLRLGFHKTIQKLRLGVQVQEEVLRAGPSLLSSKTDNEEMGNMRHQAGGEHILQPSPGVMLHLLSWAESPCGLWQLPVPRFPELGTCNCTRICPCNYCNCDHSCGDGTGKQSITHPDWKRALPPQSSKQHLQLHLAGWAPPARSP